MFDSSQLMRCFLRWKCKRAASLPIWIEVKCLRSAAVGRVAWLSIYWQDAACRLVISLRQVALAQLHKYRHQSSLYDRLYWTPAASSKQPVKDNEVVVSDWLLMSRMWHEKVSAGTFTFNEPIMYPKILKHGLPALRLEFMVLSRFIMYYRVFIRCLYANGYVSFRPKFWSTGS